MAGIFVCQKLIQGIMRPDVLEYTQRFIQKPAEQRSESGRLIVIEGCDGVGKSTAARILAEVYGAMSFSSPIDPKTKERRGAVDKEAFNDPLNRFRFFRESNALDSAKYLRPNLAEGRNIVLDRYILSTIIGNMGLGMELPPEELLVVPDIVIPDATIFLSLDPNIRAQRIAKRAAELGKAKTDNVIDNATDVQSRVSGLLDELTEYGIIKVDTTGLEPMEVVSVIVDKLETVGVMSKLKK